MSLRDFSIHGPTMVCEWVVGEVQLDPNEGAEESVASKCN